MTYRSKTKPRLKQQAEFDNHKDAPARGLLWSMRSGKTKAMIDLAEYLFHEGRVTGVLILAPNGVHENWILKELPTHCSTPWVGHAWSSSRRGSKAHKAALQKVTAKHPDQIAFFTVNSETVWSEAAKRAMGQFIVAHKGKVLFVADESHDFRSPSSKRFRIARGIGKLCSHKRILTGTPSSNSPLAVWSQFELLAEAALGFKTFGDFKAQYAVVQMARTKTGRMFETIVGYRNLDDLQARIAKWASVVLKADAGVPPTLDGEVVFGLTEKQRALYDKVSKELMLHDQLLEGGALLGKLQQITRGWYYREDGTVEYVVKPADNPALQTLLKQIKDATGKVIVWARHREELDLIQKTLDQEGISSVSYRGGMTGASRTDARTRFNSDPNLKVFIGQPKAGGVGLDLSAADLIVWYSHVFDLIDYEQASERASAAWKTKGVDVIHLIAHNTVDGYIRSAHRRKADISSEVSGSGLKLLLEGLDIC
jgi:hypothetical protein